MEQRKKGRKEEWRKARSGGKEERREGMREENTKKRGQGEDEEGEICCL